MEAAQAGGAAALPHPYADPHAPRGGRARRPPLGDSQSVSRRSYSTPSSPLAVTTASMASSA